MKDDYDDESIHKNMSDDYNDESMYENMSNDYNDESFNQEIKDIEFTEEEKLFCCIEENDDFVTFIKKRSIIPKIRTEERLTNIYYN